MTPMEYMAKLLQGQATAPGAGAAAALGSNQPAMSKGGTPPEAGALPTPASTTPAATTPASGTIPPQDTGLADFLRQTGGGGSSEFETDQSSLQSALDFAKKYDPNASIQDATIDQGESQKQGFKLAYDATKLPQYDATLHPDWMGDHPDQIVPILGGGLLKSGVASFADPSHVWMDPNTGLPVTYSRNININEAANAAQQTKEGGFMSQLANAIVPDSAPWMAPIMVAMMGAGQLATAAGSPGWLTQLGKSAANMAIKKIGS